MSFVIDIKFTDRAAAYLAHTTWEALRIPVLALKDQPVVSGDKIRIAGIPNCPWFVVSERYWTLGETSTLTIWLDEVAD
jgi:hypothetical protein